MNRVKHLTHSLTLLIALSSLAGCNGFPGNLFAPAASSSIEPVLKPTTGAISGLVLKVESLQASATSTVTTRTLPAKDVVVKVRDQSGRELQSIKTNANGQFFVDKLPVTTATSKLDLLVASEAPQKIDIVAGRVTDFGEVRLTNTATSQSLTNKQTVTGIFIRPDTAPLGGAEIRDKKFPEIRTTTDGQGAFTLETLGDELEVILAGQTRTVTIADVLARGTVQLDISNTSRVLLGTIKDSSNSNLNIAGAKVKIVGSSLATLTAADGSFKLFGAPISSFTFEVEDMLGYKGGVFSVSPGASGTEIVRNETMEPVGNLRINLQLENAPISQQPLDNPTGCVAGYNCSKFDVSLNNQIDEPQENFYDNSLATLTPLSGTIEVQGTGIKQKFEYPATPKRDILATTGVSSVKIGEVYLHNFIVSVPLDNVPGGRRNVTISLTGSEIQKSISVYIPAQDTVSTELIIINRARPVAGLGDMKGKVLGVDDKDLANVRINFMDVGIPLTYIPSFEGRQAFLARVETALLGADASSLDSQKNYLLRNVPTGTRAAVVGVLDSSNKLSPCYIPNTSIAINVVSGISTFVPEVTLSKRNLAGC